MKIDILHMFDGAWNILQHTEALPIGHGNWEIQDPVDDLPDDILAQFEFSIMSGHVGQVEGSWAFIRTSKGE